ncbi:MAG TPA: DNA polymerase Y family protein, partial [Actinobacteria bacterium]|nr:DNA polymerase Y family protein [Actinomycetota bacterium]
MMGRTLCVWYPDWPLRRPDAQSDDPAFVVGTRDGRPLVAAVNDLARDAGVVPGMDRRQAEGLCPTAKSLDRDLGAETVRFEPVLAVVEGLIPRVEVVEPGWLFVPISGAVKYYRGEDSLIERIAKELDGVAPGGRLGVADGPFAAHWAARSTDSTLIVTNDAAFVAELDVSSLDRDDMVATFRWLGVTTLGQLAALPRETIASRFGSQGLAAHRLASGEDRIPTPRDIPPDLDAEERYEEPLQLLDQVGFAARSVANRLLVALQPYGIAPHRVEVEAQAADGKIRTRVWRSADPFDEQSLSDRVWWQLRAWIESAGIPGGLIRLRLAPADLSDEGRQLALFEDVAARVEAERAVSRAQAILGPDAVLEARPQGGRDPQDRVRWHRWGEEEPDLERELDAPWPGRIPDPAPTLIPPEPKLLEVEWDAGLPVRVRLGSRWEPVLSWAGPWRRIGKWWKSEGPFDVYQIVTSA